MISLGIGTTRRGLILNRGLIHTGDQKDWSKYVWFVIGIIVFIVVLLTALTDIAWLGGLGYGWVGAWPVILALFVGIGFMAWIIWGEGRGVPTTGGTRTT